MLQKAIYLSNIANVFCLVFFLLFVVTAIAYKKTQIDLDTPMQHHSEDIIALKCWIIVMHFSTHVIKIFFMGHSPGNICSGWSINSTGTVNDSNAHWKRGRHK